MVSILLLGSAGAAGAQRLTRAQVAERVAATVESTYVFPDKGTSAARFVRQRSRRGVYDRLANERAFVEAITADLYSITQDKHLVVRWSEAGYPPEGSPAQISPEIQAREARQARRLNAMIPEATILAGNVGYLRIDGFLAPDVAGSTIAAAMAFLTHADALIVDLRANGGGDASTVALTVSYLMPPQTQLTTYRNRGGAREEQSWTLPIVPGGRWSLTRPVYVLTSGRTFSAAEEFAYDLQQLRRATVVGAVTRGGANPGVIRRLSDNHRMFVPNEAAVNPVSGTNWEGVGVRPDVPVPPEEALGEAHRLALQALLSRVETNDEKRVLEEALATTAGSRSN